MRHEFITQSQVEGQLLADLEIVLHVIELARLLEDVVDERGDLSIGQSAQQEIGRPQAGRGNIIRIACELTGKLEEAAGHGRLQHREVDARFDLGADLDGVTAADQSQAVDYVIDVLDLHRRLVL